MSVAEIFETMTYGPAPESPRPAMEWLHARAPALGLFIGNQMVPQPKGSTSTASIPPPASISSTSPNPARPTSITLWRWPGMPSLAASALPGHARARYLYAWRGRYRSHARLLAVLETLDNGKPIRKAWDIVRAAG